MDSLVRSIDETIRPSGTTTPGPRAQLVDEVIPPNDTAAPQPRLSESPSQRYEAPLGGTCIDELLRSILDRLDQQEVRTSERLNAIAAAQEVSQVQIERLQSPEGRIARPHSDDEIHPRQRTPVEERTTNRQGRPSSVVVGSRHAERTRKNASNQSRNPRDGARAHRTEDSEVAPIPLDQELEQLRSTMKDMSSKMHRATSSAPDIEKVLEETQRSPFTSRISGVRIRHISKVKLANYDGLEDPRPFLTSVSIAIGRAHFSKEEREAGSCQLFVEHLSGAALTWFSRLEADSIDSFRELTTSFLKNYGVLMQKGKSNADLWTMAQTQKESLRDFIGRFKAVITNVSTPDEAAIAALRNALWHESRFREDLILNEPETLPDALHRANRYIAMEEEKAAMSKRQASAKVATPKEKSKEEHHEPRQHYDTDYARDYKSHKVSTYHIGNPSSQTDKPWNKWNRETDARADAKTGPAYCEYHKSSSHSTEDCRQLQNLLLTRFKEGNLDIEHEPRRPPPRNKDRRVDNDNRNRRDDRRREDELDRRGERPRSTERGEYRKRANDAPRQVDEPAPRRRINMIMGGLTSCRDSVRSIKSYRRRASTQRTWIEKTAPPVTNSEPISFSEEDAAGLACTHNDPLVVEILIGESAVSKVLIDTGSSVNVIFKDVVLQMEVDLRQASQRIQPLTGFDGDSIMTIGTITLPIYVGGTVSWFDFAVVDKPTVYNVILGTPWLHKMKAVASTYHQCVKFPTRRGIHTLRGDPLVARTCFMIERKLRNAREAGPQ